MATITSPRPQSPANSSRNAIQSPSLTPSSSVRPSIDLPNTTTGTNGRAASPARRARAALRDYYNLKSKPPSSTSPGPGGGLSRTASVASVESESTVTSNVDGSAHTTTATLPAQLDEPSFDANAYVQNLLATETLRGLLKIEGALVSEIKQLDGERKALVYDNYSKLIVATRTIGRMQRSLEGGGEGEGIGMQRMERLRPAVEGVERVAGELGRAGDEGRAKDAAEERAERRRQREKRELVRWVVEAPGRFEAYVRDGKIEVVREEWEVLDGLLKKWEGVKGVEEVRLACQKMVGGLEKAGDEDEGEGEGGAKAGAGAEAE